MSADACLPPFRAKVFSSDGWVYLHILSPGEDVAWERGTVTLIVMTQGDDEDFPAFERRIRDEAGKAAASRGLRIGF